MGFIMQKLSSSFKTENIIFEKKLPEFSGFTTLVFLPCPDNLSHVDVDKIQKWQHGNIVNQAHHNARIQSIRNKKNGQSNDRSHRYGYG